MTKKTKIGKNFGKMNGTSNLEDEMAGILSEMNIRYWRYYYFKGKEFDFFLLDYKILLEIHGCFFHCCKEHFPEQKYDLQKKNKKNDQHKLKMVKFDKEHSLLVIWEHEVKDYDKVKIKINEFIENKKTPTSKNLLG